MPDAGVVWLARTADLLGLRMEPAMASVLRRRRDAGPTLAQMVLALADGATFLSDLAAIHAPPFGVVASEATA